MKLKPLPTKEELEKRPQGWDNPLVACELCGKSAQSHLMFNVTIGLPVAGHPAINSIFCQHWACPDHWREVAHACIDEHIIQQHKEAHLVIASNTNTDNPTHI